MSTNDRFSNWLFTFLEGLLLLVFSYFIFTQPTEVFEKLVLTGGWVSLAIGAVNVVRYFFGEQVHHTLLNLLSSALLVGMGILLLTGVNGAREWILVLLTGVLLLLAVHVLLHAWDVKYQFEGWWLNLILLAYSLFTAYLVVSRQPIWGIPINIWTGIQVLLLGLMMIWLAVTDRRISLEFKKTLDQLK
jgi:uncharacterized membrane protein HdeD (DUF308 family)